MIDKSFFGDFLEELSPFRKKYFFFIFIFIFIFIAINIPLNNYYGITLSSKSEILDVKHRILFDLSFITTFVANLYFLITYYLKGVSNKLKSKLINVMEKAASKKEQKKSSSFKEMILFHMIYLISFFGFFLMPPSTSVKYSWINQGNIYLDFIILYIFCLGFIFLNLFLIISREVNKNDRTTKS